MPNREDVLRHLTLGDAACLQAAAAGRQGAPLGSRLDHAAETLVKVAALVVTDGSDLTWHQTVAAALDAGVTRDEVVDVLVVLAPIIGQTRVIAVAPKLASATGYDVDAALEAMP